MPGLEDVTNQAARGILQSAFNSDDNFTQDDIALAMTIAEVVPNVPRESQAAIFSVTKQLAETLVH